LQLKEVDKQKFKIASGEIVDYPVSEAYIIVNERGVTSLVAIAPEKTPILFGVTTLELLGLQVDPVAGKLTPLTYSVRNIYLRMLSAFYPCYVMNNLSTTSRKQVTHSNRRVAEARPFPKSFSPFPQIP